MCVGTVGILLDSFSFQSGPAFQGQSAVSRLPVLRNVLGISGATVWAHVQ
jgi:hypothetical protein